MTDKIRVYPNMNWDYDDGSKAKDHRYAIYNVKGFSEDDINLLVSEELGPIVWAFFNNDDDENKC